jgi:hypothetical protein
MHRAGSALALTFTLAVSLAANITWAARDGDLVAIAAGIATPIALVMAVHQWRAHTSARGYQRVLRVLGMAAVTGTAAAWTWTHTTRLLLAHQLETPLAYIAPLAIDGLAVMATMALWPTANIRPAAGEAGTSTVPPAASQDAAPRAQPPATATWDGPDTVDVVPCEEQDGPASVPHPVEFTAGWDDPDTDPDAIPVPPCPTSDPQPAPVVPLQVTGQDGAGTAERPTDDDLVAQVLAWDAPVPGIGTLAGRLGIGKTRAGRIKTMAEDARGTSRDGQASAVGW